jgi:hypothetical protein
MGSADRARRYRPNTSALVTAERYSCDLPGHNLAIIILPLSVAALPTVADSGDLTVHYLVTTLPLNIVAVVSPDRVECSSELFVT